RRRHGPDPCVLRRQGGRAPAPAHRAPAARRVGAGGRRYRGRVTRIISGRAGSLTLAVPDAGTRPTSDRVRESLFGALEAGGLLDGARVVDLFAGSGALALESLSRGAATADLVERNARAA